ncbi:hypothetical protein CE91St41_08360 [Oscillospiraceae bacterium]|nr:hypothetical protein CE91St40_08360 [Oscillospiraceae bacterium]BDF73947.1 hypothetical protein CE91St41_08360 [Oscillospiraceae bacterium]
MKLLREPPRWLPPLALLAAAALILALAVRFPAGQTPEAPAPEFSFRAGGAWYPLGTTETGMLGEPLCVEETSYDAPYWQFVGVQYRREIYGDTELTYTYLPADGAWQLSGLTTTDPNLVLWPGVRVGDGVEELRAGHPELFEARGRICAEREWETDFFPHRYSLDLTQRDGAISEAALYSNVVYGTLAPSLYAGSEVLSLSPCADETGPFRPDSFTGELAWPYGAPIPLDWAGAANTRVCIYSSWDAEPTELYGADELPVLEPGSYFVALICDLTAEDGQAYRYGASCNIKITAQAS